MPYGEQTAEGLCLVFDTSSLVKDDGESVRAINRLLEQKCHVLVIPSDVVDELKGLKNANGDTAKVATGLLALCERSPMWRDRKAVNPPHGIVKQLEREKYNLLLRYARATDTQILACACYFAYRRRESTEGGLTEEEERDYFTEGPDSTSSSTERNFFKRHTVFVTEDVVLRIKASAYNVTTMNMEELRKAVGV